MNTRTQTPLQVHIALQVSLADTALDLQLNAVLNGGEILALYGPSGAGKTTLLRALAGLLPAQAGLLKVGERVCVDVARGTQLPARARNFGVQFQAPALLPHLDVRAQLRFADHKADDAWIAQLLADFDLQELAGQLPHQLSGGQQQRVALARALVSKPAMLLLDEPLSAQDGARRLRLQACLQTHVQALGAVAILVSHDLAEVFRLAHQVAQLRDGRVIATGTPRQVLLPAQRHGRLAIHGRVLCIDNMDVATRVSVAVGDDIISTLVTHAEAAAFVVGDEVQVWLNGASAQLASLHQVSARE